MPTSLSRPIEGLLSEARFYFVLVDAMAFQGKTWALQLELATKVLGKRGRADEVNERLRAALLEQIRGLPECLRRLNESLRIAMALAQGHYKPYGSYRVSTRWLADQASKEFQDSDTAIASVSGEGTEVWIEGDIEDGIAAIVCYLGTFGRQERIAINVDGAEIAFSPIPDDKHIRRAVSGLQPLFYKEALAVKLVCARGGSVVLGRDTLTIRFDEHDPWADRS
jgi:hypothetical protein